MVEKKTVQITRVEVQKHNKNRYSIYLDGEYGFAVGEDILVRYSLLKGTELESEFIENVLKEEEQSKAVGVALRYLGYRMRSKSEVAEKLAEKGYLDFTEYVLEYLESNRYLNDLEFAICFAKDKFGLNGFGKARVRIELLKKGIEQGDIDTAIEEVFDAELELQAARDMALKKINGSYRNDEEIDKYRKTSSYLYRKGYSSDVIKSVLKEVL